MSISGTEFGKGPAKTAFFYLLISLGCALFGAFYEQFSHGVWSVFMVYAFLFPLMGGAVPFLAAALVSGRGPGGRVYHWGIAALTVGSIIQGILEIYGTTNALVCWYWIIGAGLCLGGILSKVKSGGV